MTQFDRFLTQHTVSKTEKEITFKICLSLTLRREERNRELSFPEHWAADLSAFLFCCFYHLKLGWEREVER